MTWEETIQFVRNQPEYEGLVKQAYFGADLVSNVLNFKKSEEYIETLRLIRYYYPQAKTILDIGAGNGISSIAFALDGYDVTVTEPDPSNTVGYGAISFLKENFSLPNLTIHGEFAEKIDFSDKLFDIVYVRQAMHHAYDLKLFVKNIARLLKSGGFLITVRDHVIFNIEDKKWFLDTHPLHKFYGGENAFMENEYVTALNEAGLEINKMFRYYESVINYFPLSKNDLNKKIDEKNIDIKNNLIKKIGFIGKVPFILSLYKRKLGITKSTILDERSVPGRMYSFIAQKK
jgi:SAM-dependent methyltransferase